MELQPSRSPPVSGLAWYPSWYIETSYTRFPGREACDRYIEYRDQDQEQVQPKTKTVQHQDQEDQDSIATLTERKRKRNDEKRWDENPKNSIFFIFHFFKKRCSLQETRINLYTFHFTLSLSCSRRWGKAFIMVLELDGAKRLQRSTGGAVEGLFFKLQEGVIHTLCVCVCVCVCARFFFNHFCINNCNDRNR